MVRERNRSDRLRVALIRIFSLASLLYNGREATAYAVALVRIYSLIRVLYNGTEATANAVALIGMCSIFCIIVQDSFESRFFVPK